MLGCPSIVTNDMQMHVVGTKAFTLDLTANGIQQTGIDDLCDAFVHTDIEKWKIRLAFNETGDGMSLLGLRQAAVKATYLDINIGRRHILYLMYVSCDVERCIDTQSPSVDIKHQRHRRGSRHRFSVVDRVAHQSGLQQASIVGSLTREDRRIVTTDTHTKVLDTRDGVLSECKRECHSNARGGE